MVKIPGQNCTNKQYQLHELLYKDLTWLHHSKV